jgi:Uma2 family endonuclease
MSAVPVTRFTLAEYLAREEAAASKSEFYGGQVFAMAGGTAQHGEIAVNIVGGLLVRLRGTPCRPYNSDVQVYIPANGLVTYPDAYVVCGGKEFDSQAPNAIINPSVIFEVLSKSTENYDRSQKFQLYSQLDSFREYVLVAQDKPRVERFVRRNDGSWILTNFVGLDAVVELTTLGCSLSLAEIYEGVTFRPDEGTERPVVSS